MSYLETTWTYIEVIIPIKGRKEDDITTLIEKYLGWHNLHRKVGYILRDNTIVVRYGDKNEKEVSRFLSMIFKLQFDFPDANIALI